MEDPGGSRTRFGATLFLVLGLLGLLAAIGAVWFVLRPAPFPEKITLGAGVEDGTWDKLGSSLVTLLEDRQTGLQVLEMRTDGSIDNIELLERGELDLAFVQGDSAASESVRLIAPLYDNVLHVVARRDEETPITGLADLVGLRVAVGADRSGTIESARFVLEHSGLDWDAMRKLSLDTKGSQKAFEDGEVEAVFHFSALGGEAVRKLLATRDADLVPLGECHENSALRALCADRPGFECAAIPTRMYGRLPEQPVGTVSVKAVLACRADLDERFVRRLTEILFDGQAELAREHPALGRLSESFDRSDVPFPLHPGADAYYHRRDPPFYVKYADPLSLVLTILLAGISAGLTARQWIRRRKKNRIDHYYLEIQEVSSQLRQAAPERLGELLDTLEGVRRRAFHDLVRERVRADQSFTIFQDFLQAEVEAIRRRMKE